MRGSLLRLTQFVEMPYAVFMSIDPPISEIPIYRTSLAAWCEERRDEESKMRRDMKESYGNSRWPLPVFASDEAVDAVLAYQHRGWHYNETVGWIRIFVSRQKIWGEFFVCKERVSKTLRHKNFEWQGKAFETGTFSEDSSADIFFRICRELDRVSNERWCKDRHMDKDGFLLAGVVMNWRKLTGLE